MTILLLIAFFSLLTVCARFYFSYHSLVRELLSISAQIEKMLSAKTFSYVTCTSSNGAIHLLVSNINHFVSAYQKQEITDRRKKREILRIMTNISHDLRTPLTILFGYIERLVQRVNKEPIFTETHKLAQKLSDKTRSANRMISQLLDMSRIHSGDYIVT